MAGGVAHVSRGVIVEHASRDRDDAVGVRHADSPAVLSRYTQGVTFSAALALMQVAREGRGEGQARAVAAEWRRQPRLLRLRPVCNP